MEIMVKDIAKICHEANKSYCESIGDTSQKSWDDAPAWQRESAVKGVEHLIKNPMAGPEDSHISWLAEKKSTGWKFGHVKDETKKEHPCFVEYSKLPEKQKLKDYLFSAVAKTFI